MLKQKKSFYNKYLKYKLKYKLLKNQKGGLVMSDDRPDKFHDILEKHFQKYPQFDEILQNSEPQIDLSFLETDDYNKIYDDLFKIIITDKIYNQKFVDSSGNEFYNKEGMHNYHIQLCALIMMNYVIECELFSIVHNFKKYNIKDDSCLNNNLPIIFNGSQEYRYYKSITTYSDMIFQFVCTLDDLFYNFMDILVKKIASYANETTGIIYERIVPINHKDHKEKYDFIYVDWKDRINNLLTEETIINGKIYYIDKKTNYSSSDKPYPLINIAIEESMIEISKGNKYIADGLGFYSFMHLDKKDTVSDHYGSCITSSIFELYFAARLHVHANNLILSMEKASSEMTQHGIWKKTQNNKKILIPILSHWSTQFNFQSKTIKLRSTIGTSQYDSSYEPYEHVGDIYFSSNDKLRMCLLLLLPIFDSYLKYIEPLQEGPVKKYIEYYINKKADYIEKLFDKIIVPQKKIRFYGIDFDLSDAKNELDRIKDIITHPQYRIDNAVCKLFVSANKKLKIRSDNLSDNEIKSIIIFAIAREKDRIRNSFLSALNSQVYYNNECCYKIYENISDDTNSNYTIIKLSDIDENFNKLYIHYKIHRISKILQDEYYPTRSSWRYDLASAAVLRYS